MAGLKVKVVERRGDRRRRGGDRGVPSGIPQLGRRLHRQPAQPEGDPRPAPARARPADRRAARAELPAGAGRPLSPVRRRPDRAPRSPSSARATPSATPPSTARSTWRPTCCATWCCRRRRTCVGLRRPRRADQGRRARPQAAAAARTPTCARSTTCSPIGRRAPRQLVRDRSGQGAASASTPWSATTPAPTRPAPATCCCITPSAR